MKNRPLIRHTRSSDIKPLLELQERVYPTIRPWPESTLLQQIETFPQGQIVAEVDGQLVGAASSLMILWDEWDVEHTWKEITSRGSFNTHNPEGRTLYGAEVFVQPELRGAGIGHALYRGRRQICRKLNLKRIIACGRLPGYHHHADQISALLYAQKVVWGDIFDPVLNFQLREGFDFCGTVDGYLPDDLDSLGHASLIVWLNPRYNKKKATRALEGELL
jgi:GNAT superfamily N-acetyltransferase